jgi:glycosyltransferase involved in cell wall biosynthesis
MGSWKRIISGIKVTRDVIRAMKKNINLHQPNVIHLTSSASLAIFKDYLILRLAKKFNKPVIIHWRFGRIPELAIKKNWEWRFISHIIRISACSIVIDDHSYETLIAAGFKNVVNIPNPISGDLEKIAQKRVNLARNVEDGKVIYVGHVEQNKGVFELLEACVAIIAVKQLVLVGPALDCIKTKLQTIARIRGDDSWLVFAGAKCKEDVFSKISSSELLVLPSYTEGFPYVILEAMSLACPLVATNVGAIPEMLNIKSDSPAGICVPIKDVKTLRASIEKLLSNKELSASYGQNGLTRVLENFTLDKIFKQYLLIWQTFSNIK